MEEDSVRDTTISAKDLDHTERVMLEWNNDARLSLSPQLYLWLAALVVTSLASVAFVRDHVPPRFVLAGFIVSHGLVAGLAYWRSFVVRRGTVSTLHCLCWTAGWLLVFIDLVVWSHEIAYQRWATAYVLIVGVSGILDIRDMIAYLKRTKNA